MLEDECEVVFRPPFVNRDVKTGVPEPDFIKFEVTGSEVEEAGVESCHELVGIDEGVARLVSHKKAFEDEVVKKLKVDGPDFDLRFEFRGKKIGHFLNEPILDCGRLKNEIQRNKQQNEPEKQVFYPPPDAQQQPRNEGFEGIQSPNLAKIFLLVGLIHK